MRRMIVACVVAIFLVPVAASGQWLPAVWDSGDITDPYKLTAYIGWMEHPEGVSFGTDVLDDQTQFEYKAPLRGLWLGFALEGALTDTLGVVLSGGGLVSGKAGGVTTEAALNLPPDYPARTVSQWWGYLDAMVMYSLGKSRSFSAVGGF
jgi:hypothetical protein